MISIIVPVYNVEKYLIQCINSIINQTYKNIEIILVDDKSTDSSGKICDEFLKKDKRIKVIHKSKNEGLGYARNTALDIIKGDYVTFVDSDDYLDEDAIEIMYNAIQKKQVDACIGGFKRVNDDEIITKKVIYKEEEFRGSKEVNNLLFRLIGSAPDKKDAIKMSVWNCMYNTRIIKDYNVKFESEREYLSEDIFFDIKYYNKANSVAILNNACYNYRYNEKSLTKKYRQNRFELSKKMYEKEKEELKKISLYDEAKYRLSRQFFIYTLACIRQENIKISNKTLKEALKSIKKICNDNLLRKIIEEYPIGQLGKKQKVFLKLIQHKKAFVLYIASKKRRG